MSCHGLLETDGTKEVQAEINREGNIIEIKFIRKFEKQEQIQSHASLELKQNDLTLLLSFSFILSSMHRETACSFEQSFSFSTLHPGALNWTYQGQQEN